MENSKKKLKVGGSRKAGGVPLKGVWGIIPHRKGCVKKANRRKNVENCEKVRENKNSNLSSFGFNVFVA